MPLNERQLAALPALDWLLSLDESDRRTGRSWLMAVALVRRAARETTGRGRYWSYQDLLPEIAQTQQWQIIGPIVQNLIAGNQRLSPHVTYRRDGFRLQLPEPIEDWLPSDDPFNMTVDYAEMETRIMASMGLTEDQLRNADPHRLAADATRRDTAMRDNFTANYGWHPAPTPGLRRAMQRTAHTTPQAIADPHGQMMPSATVVAQGVRQTDRAAEQSIHRWVEPTNQVAVYAGRLPSDVNLTIPLSTHGVDGMGYKLKVLKSRADPPPPPPTAWERIMGDDAF